MTEGAQAQTHPDDGSGADHTGKHQDEPDDLQGKVTKLGEFVTTYEGSPESIDGSNLADTKKMLGDINEHIRDQIDRDVFEGDEDQYAEFYGKAMKALDKYGYVRAAYDKVDPSARAAKLGQNEFAQAVQNADLFVEQRWKCIEALRDLHDKLSSELKLFTVRARLGIAQVPSDRGLFFGLTVAEHFRLDGQGNPADMDAAFDHFPTLRPLPLQNVVTRSDFRVSVTLLRGAVVFVDRAAEHPPTLHRRGKRHDRRLVVIGWRVPCQNAVRSR